ncbi:adrenocorticotropic hormone receptor-like [Dendronephthya gigantea]|uniref:adrenocorticotropic hormone receptor-like n=1 Tax=Dendronephthya gigantea TaxID=151771 RepID=UPI00106B596D|nr:adrenocorticotropic hormone receptor-like [Dendronephthya gigantea]
MHHLEMAVAECGNTSAPVALSITSASISALLLVVTVPTNFLVCLAIILDPNRELRTQFNCFTFNLGLADLIVGCIAEPVSIYAHYTEAFASEHGHEVSNVVLKMFHIPYFISAMASVLSIAALACERDLAINSPFLYRRYFNVRLTVVFAAIIWLIAFTFGLLNLVFDYILESFIFINSGALFTGTLVCFAFCCIRVNLKRASNQWQQNERNQIKRGRDMITQAKLTKTFSLMIGALMFCYVPACSIVYFINLCTNCNCDLVQWFRDAAFWLILLNSAIDPYVYAIRSSTFRNAIYKIIKCKCRQRRQPRTFQSIRYFKRNVQRVSTNYGALDSTDSSQASCQIEERTQLIYKS